MKAIKSLATLTTNRIFVGFEYISAVVSHVLQRPTRLGTAKGRLGPPRWSRTLNATEKTGDRLLCIFVLYTTEPSLSTLSYLKALRTTGFEIAAINNMRCSDDLIRELSTICWRIYDRTNIGRDIGAYKDGILMLRSENLLSQCKALCLANDSTLFIPGLYGDSFSQAISSFLAGPNSALFSHDSHQITKHYQSYFQVVKSEVINSEPFIRFWQQYRPLSHRSHCIRKGEVRSSEEIYNKISRTHVLYTSEFLLRAISHLSAHESIATESILAMMPSITHTMQRKDRTYALEKLVSAAKEGEALNEVNQHCLAELVEASNPSHLAAFLYPKFLHCPLIKKDLCLAGSFSMGKALQLFHEALQLSGVHSDEIETRVGEFRTAILTKGIPADYRRKPRERALKGVPDGFTYTGP